MNSNSNNHSKSNNAHKSKHNKDLEFHKKEEGKVYNKN